MCASNNYNETEPWDWEFSIRQQRRYRTEDTKLFDVQPDDKLSLIEALCKPRSSWNLEPPEAFAYSSLHHFLEAGNIRVLQNETQVGSAIVDQVLLDERQDPLPEDVETRQWGPGPNVDYLRNSPEGNVNISEAVNLPTLIKILSEKVSSQSTGR